MSHSNHQHISHLQNQPGQAHLIQTSSTSSEGQRVPQQSSAQAWYTDGRIETGNHSSSSAMIQGQQNHLNQHPHTGMYLFIKSWYCHIYQYKKTG